VHDCPDLSKKNLLRHVKKKYRQVNALRTIRGHQNRLRKKKAVKRRWPMCRRKEEKTRRILYFCRGKKRGRSRRRCWPRGGQKSRGRKETACSRKHDLVPPSKGKGAGRAASRTRPSWDFMKEEKTKSGIPLIVTRPGKKKSAFFLSWGEKETGGATGRRVRDRGNGDESRREKRKGGSTLYQDRRRRVRSR